MPSAFVLISTDVGTEGEVLARLKGMEGVKEVHQVYGAYDIITKLDAESMEGLKGMVEERIRQLGHVRNTITMMVVHS